MQADGSDQSGCKYKEEHLRLFSDADLDLTASRITNLARLASLGPIFHTGLIPLYMQRRLWSAVALQESEAP